MENLMSFLTLIISLSFEAWMCFQCPDAQEGLLMSLIDYFGEQNV